MDTPDPVAPEVRRRMRAVVTTAIASRRMTLAEAAAEARGLGRGLQPALPASVVEDAVTEILRELSALPPQPEAVEHQGVPLRPAAPEEVADALAYAMTFDSRGKARRTGVEYAAKLAAEGLVRHLQASGYVIMRKPPLAPHGSR
jgi:hypothetical protein